MASSKKAAIVGSILLVLVLLLILIGLIGGGLGALGASNAVVSGANDHGENREVLATTGR